ncbi:motility associated factor glycosyltransferase family protein [Vibrio sp. C8]
MSTEFYNSNIAILKHRFPKLAEAIDSHSIDHLKFEVVERLFATLSINGIQLSSAYDPVEEALAYRCMTSDNTYHMWGFGIGSVPEVLLNDKNLEKIHIYVYNLDIIKLVLTLMPKMWLADERIELHYVHKDMSNINPILNVGLFGNSTFVINSDLHIAKYSRSNLDWIVHRIENRLLVISVNRSHTNPDSMKKLLSIDEENYPLLKKMHVIDHLIENNRFKDVLCIGAGPSLDAHIEDVKALAKLPNRPLFMAPSTALRALLKHGIKPDILTVIDTTISAQTIHFDKLPKTTTLIGSSRIQKEIFERWKGKKYYCHMVDETFDSVNEKLPSKYRMSVFGSVIHPMTNMAILFGAETIRYIGCDFGFPGDKIHASTEKSLDLDMSVTVENGYGEMIKSEPTYRMFCSGIENLIAQCPHIDFINMSRLGARIVGARYEDEAK